MLASRQNEMPRSLRESSRVVVALMRLRPCRRVWRKGR